MSACVYACVGIATALYECRGLVYDLVIKCSTVYSFIISLCLQLRPSFNGPLFIYCYCNLDLSVVSDLLKGHSVVLSHLY